jgi:hypothetical protein
MPGCDLAEQPAAAGPKRAMTNVYGMGTDRGEDAQTAADRHGGGTAGLDRRGTTQILRWSTMVDLRIDTIGRWIALGYAGE